MCNWVRCASSFANPVACPASWSPSPLLFYAFSFYLENVSSKLVKIEQCLWAVAAFNSVVWGNDNTEMNSLSEEILLHIFGSLSAIHLCSASLVSKLWYSLICDDRYASIIIWLPLFDGNTSVWKALAQRRGYRLPEEKLERGQWRSWFKNYLLQLIEDGLTERDWSDAPVDEERLVYLQREKQVAFLVGKNCLNYF